MNILVLIVDHVGKGVPVALKKHGDISARGNKVVGYIASNLIIVRIDEAQGNGADELAQQARDQVFVMRLFLEELFTAPDGVGDKKHQDDVEGRQQRLINIKPVLFDKM